MSILDNCSAYINLKHFLLKTIEPFFGISSLQIERLSNYMTVSLKESYLQGTFLKFGKKTTFENVTDAS